MSYELIAQLNNTLSGSPLLQYGVSTVFSETAYRNTVKPYVDSAIDYVLPSPYTAPVMFGKKAPAKSFWQNGFTQVTEFAASEISEHLIHSQLPNLGGVEKVIANGTGQLIGSFAGRLAEYPMAAFSPKP
jgi:hypothetical protein